MDRRKFLQGTLLGLGVYSLHHVLEAKTLFSTQKQPISTGAYTKTEDLYILHTNDIHSRIEPFPVGAGKFAGQGGLSRIAQLVNQLRGKYDNVLLVDAGDVFQGTPYFNYFGGELEYKIMSQMRYDAGTLGNHDFDAGLEGLNKAMEALQFPLLNCNYDFTASDLDRKIFPYHILQKGNLKIGIIGAGIRIKGLISESMAKGIVYHDPIALTEELAKELKQKGCHVVVCLSHLGFQYENTAYPDDISLAKNTKNIDVIIGGHTHTFMDAPLLLKNQANKNVLIHQVGWAGLRLGILKLQVNIKTREIKYEV